MKLKKKCRNSSKIKKSYYPAQTPYQRLKNTNLLKKETVRNLESVHHSLDPVRLLKQIQFLQDALWQHVVLAKELSKDEEKKPLYGFKLQSTPEEPSDSLILKPGIMKRRQYRKTKKPRVKVKHWWRTRKDPFEDVWDEVCIWLEKNPERTATAMLLKLQGLYPGKYTKGQLRTLQRRVKAWREKAIILYDDNQIKNDLVVENMEIGQLKAKPVDRPENLKKTSVAV